MCFTALQIASKEIAATWLQQDGICHGEPSGKHGMKTTPLGGGSIG